MFTLIIIAYVHNGNVVTMHDYTTKASCEAAREVVVEMIAPLSSYPSEKSFRDGRRIKCVEKYPVK